MADKIYKVRDPSGNIREIKGPEGETDEQVIKQAQILFSAPEQQTIQASEPQKYHIGDLGGLSKTPFTPDLGGMGYNLGGQVTDATGSPGLGYAANVALQAVGPYAASKAIGTLAQPAMEGAGKFLMRSALNAPLKDRLNGNAERAVGTLLNEGYNPTMGGVDAMRTGASQLGAKVTNITQNSPNVFDPNTLYPTIREKLIQAKTQVNPEADTNAIRSAWLEFINSVKNPLSVADAQALKEGTYRALGDKAYGVTASGEISKQTAEKALARALKDKIAQLEPETAPLLKQQSDLLNAAKIAQRRAGTDQGLKVAGLAPIAPTTSKMLAMLLDKYTLLKSLMARGLYSGAERIPQAGVGTAMALGQGLLGRKQQQQDEERAALAAQLQGQQ